METTEKGSLSDTIIDGVKKAILELEEFRLQAALGKAEAHDAFEGAKKKFNTFVHEAKLKLDNAKDVVKERSVQLKTLLETLQVQLALGKAETKEVFEEQRKKIAHALNELETLIKKNKTTDEFYTRLQMEVEKFKIKLDILKLRYDLNKLEARNEFEEKKVDFSQKLSDLKKRLEKKEGEVQDKWEHFRTEITDAYSHLKKAFVK